MDPAAVAADLLRAGEALAGLLTSGFLAPSAGGGAGPPEEVHDPFVSCEDDGSFDMYHQDDEHEDLSFESHLEEIDGDWYTQGPYDSEDVKPASFGVVCGNWGGDRKYLHVQEHMIRDIIESPGHVFGL